MERPRTLSRIADGSKVVSYLDLAYKDFLGARVLLNATLLSQGAVLASTAVEKYLKAILAFRGNEARGHLSQKHISSAMNYDPRLASSLSSSFLALLTKAYDIRYTDSLPKGFNIVLADREFLAELDFTAISLHQSFQMQLGVAPVTTALEHDLKRGEPNLYQNNHFIQRLDKQTFIASAPQNVYELRNCRYRGLFEARYVSPSCPSDGNFLREGLRPLDDNGMQYQFSLAPQQPSNDGE